MKLDLMEIDKLSPRGLYALAELRAFISVLAAVVKAGIGSARQVRSYTFMLVQYRKSLRERAQYNQNLKIKTWVMMCPERTAWVRSVIGEATIRCWIVRMRAAYFSPVIMGDRREEEPAESRRRKYGPHIRKPFALAKLSQVEKLLPFRPRWPRNIRRGVQAGYALSGDTGNLRHAARFNRAGHLKKSQSAHSPHRQKPCPQEPVRFFPSELGIKIQTPPAGHSKGTQKHIEAPPKQIPEKLNGPNKPCLSDAPEQKHPP